jgi:hypothetical protein
MCVFIIITVSRSVCLLLQDLLQSCVRSVCFITAGPSTKHGKLFFVFSVRKNRSFAGPWTSKQVGGAQGREGRGRGEKGDPPFHPDGGASAPGRRPLTQRMGGTFSRKQSEHRLRRDFVVTLLVTHKRLKNQKTYHDEGKDAMLNDMEKIERSWKFFDSQVILVPAYSVLNGRSACPGMDAVQCVRLEWT